MSLDPTSRNERVVNDAIKSLLKKGAIDQRLYQRLRTPPGSTKPSLFYGQPKIHKENVPLRPIVSSIGTATNKVSSYIVKILSPLVELIESTITNTTDFCEQLQDITIDEEMKYSSALMSNHSTPPFQSTKPLTSLPPDLA